MARQALARVNNQTYIPACTADDYYNFKQCFGNHGWCWCSQPDGNPIAGTFHHEKDSLNQPACEMHRGKMLRVEKKILSGILE